MQVFVPHKKFNISAQALDNKRLGNQCYRECLTLYRGSWPNHPVAKIWENYKYRLCDYAESCAVEMLNRKAWKDGVAEKWIEFWKNEKIKYDNKSYPPIIRNPRLRASHRSNLLRKGIEDATFSELKSHADFPSKKGKWKQETYELAWKFLGGKPESLWYGKFNWQEPDNLPYVWA